MPKSWFNEFMIIETVSSSCAPRWAQLYYTMFLNETKQKIEQELQEIGVEESKKQNFLLAAASSYSTSSGLQRVVD